MTAVTNGRRSSGLLRLLLFLCFSICDVRAQFFGVPPSEWNCSMPVRPAGNRTVNVAMLFWGPPASADGGLRVVWTRNPLSDGWTGLTDIDRMVFRAYLLWEERMQLPAEYGGGPGLILLDGSVLRFNLTWFNAGEQSGYADLGSDEYSAAAQASWVNTLVRQLANASGPYGRQHFLLSPLQGNEVVTLLTSLACEASGSCLVVSPSAIEARLFICQEPMPVDCIQRKRRVGSRRFEATVSAASNGDYWASGSLALLVRQGIKRVYVIAESWSEATIVQLRSTSKELGVTVLGVLMIEPFSASWAPYNTSASAVTAQIQSLAPDMLIVISSGENAALLQLLQHFQSIDYLPTAVAWLAGGAAFLPLELRQFFLVETSWLPELSGESYRALPTAASVEAFPANATHDSPAVFADAYKTRFSEQVPHSLFFQATRALHATTIVQKLLEHAHSEDTASLQQSAARIAVPGVFHEIQFEPWGRSLPFDNYVMQLMPDDSERILTPLGLGSDPILPIPLWSERVWNPVFLQKLSDRFAFALTAVTVAYLLGWLIWIVSCWHHPVLRVSDPLFSVLSLVGLIMLASSNFFSTFQQDGVACATGRWFLCCGLTLGFGPLVLKNLRIWSLWHNQSNTFAPAPVRQWHLLGALVGLLLIDVIILTAWYLDTGMKAYRFTVDPYRPSLDYHACAAHAHGKIFFGAEVLYKAICLIAGLYLAFKLRNVSRTYRESRSIALCVYNVSVVLSVVLPVVASEQTLGHEPALLVRNYLAMYLCASTASVMCVPKWMAVRATAAKHRANVAAARKAGLTLSSTDGGTITTMPVPLKPGLPLKSALKAPQPRADGVELQSVPDTRFPAGIGLSAVARSVDEVPNLQAALSSLLHAPRLPIMTTRPPQQQAATGRRDASRVPVNVIQQPCESTAQDPVTSESLLAAYDMLESATSELTTDELARIHTALSMCLTRRDLRNRSAAANPPFASQLQLHPASLQPLTAVSSAASSGSSSPSGSDSGAATASSLLPVTLHVRPLPPSVWPLSSPSTVDADSPQSLHAPPTSHLLTIVPESDGAAEQQRDSSSRRAPQSDVFDTNVPEPRDPFSITLSSLRL